MPFRASRVWLLSWLVWLALPGVGRAWTDAHVREAHATLRLSASEQIEVALDLVLEVRGGWLERLELPGLDEGVTLAEDAPALAVLASGEQVAAQALLRGTTVLLNFARRDGLRRGLHHLHVRYTTPRAAHLAQDAGGRVRLYWTLPGFEAGLARASITLRGPPGMSALADPELPQQLSEQAQGAEQLLTFSRLQVPRASPWTVSVALTSGPLARVAATGAQEGGAATALSERLRTLALVALAGFGLAWLTRREVARALRDQGAAESGLLLARPLAPWGMFALACAGAASFAWAPPLAAAAWVPMFVLSLPRARVRRGPFALGSFRPLTRAELRALTRAQRREQFGLPWADASSLAGALGASALALFALGYGRAALGREPWGVLALCALFALFASARSLRPRSMAEQVRLLLGAARRIRAGACALRIVAYASARGLAQPRLRLLTAARYPGLLRLELAVDSRRAARPLVLSALVEAGSLAERWLRARYPELRCERGEGGQRVALLWPVAEPGQAIEALLSHLSSESQRALFAGSAARAA